MIINRFPIFILALLTLLAFGGCDSNNRSVTLKDAKEYNAYFDTAEDLNQKQQYDSAFYYFNQAKLSAVKSRNSDRIIFALIKMSAVQQIQSDFSGSEVTATEALVYLKKVTEAAYAPIIYNTLGLVYKGQSDYDNAELYYLKSYENTNEPIYKCIIRNNIAVLYLDKKNYKGAVNLLEPLIMDPILISNAVYYAKAADNLGFAYLKSGGHKALHYLNESLTIRKKIADDFELVSTYLHLAEYYHKDNPQLSKDYAVKAYASATRVNSTDDRIETLKTLINDTGGEESKKYSLIRMNLTDSIGRIRQASKNQFAKIRYDFTKANEDNLRLTLESAQNSERNLLQGMGFVFLILLFVLLWFLIRQRNKREQLQTAYETETRIAKKLHDELANDVYNTMAFAETQDLSSNSNKETLLGTLDNIYLRTRNISKENSAIDTGINFIRHLKEMIVGYGSKDVNVLVSGMENLNWTTMQSNKKVMIYRIIQELLVNMKKHSDASLVVLSFRKIDHIVEIEYSDNGKGAVMDSMILKNGLLNVENRIEAIKGTIRFDTKSKKGFKMSFSFPI